MYGYCVIGALLLWGRLTLQKKKLYSYGDVLEHVIKSPGTRYVIQFVIFVVFGGFIAKILVSPTTAAQAVAAGMAWSRLTAKD
jgi:hypothetical protein